MVANCPESGILIKGESMRRMRIFFSRMYKESWELMTFKHGTRRPLAELKDTVGALETK